jgi:hypothetical protein
MRCTRTARSSCSAACRSPSRRTRASSASCSPPPRALPPQCTTTVLRARAALAQRAGAHRHAVPATRAGTCSRRRGCRASGVRGCLRRWPSAWSGRRRPATPRPCCPDSPSPGLSGAGPGSAELRDCDRPLGGDSSGRERVGTRWNAKRHLAARLRAAEPRACGLARGLTA